MHTKSESFRGIYEHGEFKLDYLLSIKPFIEKKISTLITSHMQNFPFLACREKGTPLTGRRSNGRQNAGKRNSSFQE